MVAPVASAERSASPAKAETPWTAWLGQLTTFAKGTWSYLESNLVSLVGDDGLVEPVGGATTQNGGTCTELTTQHSCSVDPDG